MMPDAMSEPPERTTNRSPEHLTFAEAGERLNISPDAVRMRVRRGKLATIQVNNRTFVPWPQPEQPHEPRTERTAFANRSGVQGDARLIDALQSEVTYLRSALDAEIEARRRADHLVAGLMERLPELMAGDDAPQDAILTPQRDEHRVRASDTLIDRLRRALGR